VLSFGVSFLPDATPETMSAPDYFAGAIDLCEQADALGFEYVKMTEHYLHPYGAYCPSPLMFLAAVAARTRSIRLMTGGIQASFHHPVQIATQAAMLDAMSGGRADIGFARAWLPHEFDLFEISMDESRARFIDTVEAVQRIWTQRGASADSPYFRFSDVDLLPACVQEPHPPVWVAAAPAALRHRLAAVVGGPDTAIEQISTIRAQLDPDVLLWQIDTGSQPWAVAQTTLRLFAEKVRPSLPA
jgi:alkanesulfonate monooxygenase SsuD/methylene tetrahydromethanopterin reductase-like flavin-dependent oxidoreductase (luciferase family)